MKTELFKWKIASRIIILHPGGKIFKLEMLSSFSNLKCILCYILFECGNQLNLAMPWLFKAKSATTWGELLVLLRATVGCPPSPPPPLYSRRFPLPPLSPCQPPRLPLQSWSLQCHSCYTLLLLMARYAKLLFFWQNIFWSRKQQKMGVQSPKNVFICKNAISWKYSLPDLRLPSFAKCTNGSGCAVGEHSRRNVDSVDRLQWFRGERTVSVTPKKLKNEKCLDFFLPT